MKRKEVDERALEQFVFGASSGDSGTGQRRRRGEGRDDTKIVDFSLDRKGTRGSPASSYRAVGAAWQDGDDDNVEVDLLGTSRLKKLVRVPQSKKHRETLVGGEELTSLLQDRFQTKQLEWARADGEVEDELADEPSMAILKLEGSMVESNGKEDKKQAFGKVRGDVSFPANKINISRLVDANVADPSNDRITSVMFHSAGSLLLTAGHDRHLRFFRVDGKTNDCMRTCKFNDTVISNASFLGASSEVVLSGRKPFFYGYDTETGRISRFPGLMGKGLKSHEHMIVSPHGSKVAFIGASGYVHLACGKEKTWIMDIKMNSGARAGAFLTEESMVTSGVDASVYLWDLRMQGRCISRVRHEDGTCTSALAAVPGSNTTPQYLAVGAESGAVSIFSGAVGSSSLAFKSLLNLTTQVTNIVFHPTAKILAMSSSLKTDSLRLVHMPTGTVFGNWPTSSTPLRKVQAVAFSPSGTLMAACNDRGRVLLWRLNH